MAKTDYTSVDQYLAAQPKKVQGVLRKMRSAIRKEMPVAGDVTELRVEGLGVKRQWVVAWR